VSVNYCIGKMNSEFDMGQVNLPRPRISQTSNFLSTPLSGVSLTPCYRMTTPTLNVGSLPVSPRDALNTEAAHALAVMVSGVVRGAQPLPQDSEIMVRQASTVEELSSEGSDDEVDLSLSTDDVVGMVEQGSGLVQLIQASAALGASNDQALASPGQALASPGFTVPALAVPSIVTSSGAEDLGGPSPDLRGITAEAEDFMSLSEYALTMQAIRPGTVSVRKDLHPGQLRGIYLQLMRKFGQTSRLLPWLPTEVINWEGSWLVKVLCQPVAGLMADGYKRCELMPQSTWISWGVQGCFVTAIVQGAAELKDLGNYLPQQMHSYFHVEANNGKVIAVVILGPPDSPHKAEDKGFYHHVSPKGGVCNMHRVLALYKLDVPYRPTTPYNVTGGFMLLSAQDVYGIMYDMAKHAKASPDVGIFKRFDGRHEVPRNVYGLPPDPSALDGLLTYLEDRMARPSPEEKALFYPAREELFEREESTPSIYRVVRKGGVDPRFPLRCTAPEFVVRDAQCMEQGEKYYMDKVWQAEGIVEPPLLSQRMGLGGKQYHDEWPGFIIMINGKPCYNMAKLDPPIAFYKDTAVTRSRDGVPYVASPRPVLGPAPSSAPAPAPVRTAAAAVVSAPAVTEVRPFMERLQRVELFDDDAHMHLIDVLRTRKGGLVPARNWVVNASESTLIYTLRYLLTFDVALVEAGLSRWVLLQDSNGVLHLPLLCGLHFTRLAQVDPRNDRTVKWMVVPRHRFSEAVPMLGEACKCRQVAELQEFRLLGPHCLMGRFCLSNVVLMASRLSEESEYVVMPYTVQLLPFFDEVPVSAPPPAAARPRARIVSGPPPRKVSAPAALPSPAAVSGVPAVSALSSVLPAAPSVVVSALPAAPSVAVAPVLPAVPPTVPVGVLAPSAPAPAPVVLHPLLGPAPSSVEEFRVWQASKMAAIRQAREEAQAEYMRKVSELDRELDALVSAALAFNA
jgi:hypothetical protein